MKTLMNEKKVLVVEDDPDMQIFLATLLESGGFKPIVAGSKAEGIQKTREEHPALIILDVPMPEIKGIHIYEILKQDEGLQNIPVIMISTLDRQTLLQYQKSLAVFSNQSFIEPDAFMKKPLEAEDLLTRIEEILDRSTGRDH